MFLYIINYANISSSAANLTNPGNYTLSLNTKINESNAYVFGGRQLPSFKLTFTIVGKERL